MPADDSVVRLTSLPTLPLRPDDGHKGSFGRGLIVAGSRGMSGAAALAGLGALRGGAGLVEVAVPADILDVVAGIEPSYLTHPLACDELGRLTRTALPTIRARAKLADAVAIGPGWGRSAELNAIARDLYASVTAPLVVDADALNALSDAPQLLSTHAGPRILTPHPGECARLIGASTAHVQADRERVAVELARRDDVIVILKGQGTVITDGRQIAINTTGNSGMATGGTGDVLTGVLVALLAQGLSPFDAARLGVYLHGLAGDLAADELSRPGLIASDLPRYLGAAWKKLEEAAG